MNDHPADPARRLEAHVGPGLTGIGRLYTPSPTVTFDRIAARPVPTQTIDGVGHRDGERAAGGVHVLLSKTGRQMIPPSVDFQTPPVAAPASYVNGSPTTPATDATRFPIRPMWRKVRGLRASAVTCCANAVVEVSAKTRQRPTDRNTRMDTTPH